MNRLDKISALLPTVRSEGDGVYSVASLSCEGWRYLVYPKTAITVAYCECDDWKHRAPHHPSGYRCIHILAVRAHLRKALSISNDLDRLGTHTAKLHQINHQRMIALAPVTKKAIAG